MVCTMHATSTLIRNSRRARAKELRAMPKQRVKTKPARFHCTTTYSSIATKMQPRPQRQNISWIK